MTKPSTKTVRTVTEAIDLRAKATGKDWDWGQIWKTVETALEIDERTPDQVIEAGRRAAGDPRVKTPAAIRWESNYLSTAAGTEAAAAREPVCWCGRRQSVHDHAEHIVREDRRHPFEASGNTPEKETGQVQQHLAGSESNTQEGPNT